MSIVQARGMQKRFGTVTALDNFDLAVEPGRIVGLIGPNGSGKTTALKALLGLATVDEGDVEVLGLSPYEERPRMMEQVAYIADVGTLPRWMRVRELLQFSEEVHDSFDRAMAEAVLAKTQVTADRRIGTLSKGMTVQLHLALVMAIDARLLVLDEPTLGLDIVYRQQFYDQVLNDYYTEQRSILITTHEVHEIENILTDVVFINRGRNVLSLAMDELGERFLKVVVPLERQAEVAALAPLAQRQRLQGLECVFRDVAAEQLEPFGEVTTPNLAELFVALVKEGEV